MPTILFTLLLFAQVKDLHFQSNSPSPVLNIAIINSKEEWDWTSIDSLSIPKNPTNTISLYANRLTQPNANIHQYWDFYLDSTHTKFKILTDSLAKIFPRKPYKMRYISEIRSLALQEQLLQKGKSKLPLSLHNFGFAVDAGIYRKKRYLRKGNLYQQLGTAAKQIGLYWGGDFVGFPDPGHLQYFSNTASFIQQFPLISFEFLRYKSVFEDNFQSALEKGREAYVQDTKQLLESLDQNFPQTKKISKYAISIPTNQRLRTWLEDHKNQTQYIIIFHPTEQWVYIQRGIQGYFWSVNL